MDQLKKQIGREVEALSQDLFSISEFLKANPETAYQEFKACEHLCEVLSGQGFEVVLVEKEPVLGGFARRLHHTIEGDDIQAYLSQLVDKVAADELISVLTGAKIVGFEGFKGNFSTEIAVAEGNETQKIRR